MGIGLIPWSPLARGLLAGTRARDGQRRTIRARSDPFADQLYDASDFDVVDALAEVAGERGLPAAQVALAWLFHRPGVVAPAVGATKVEHVDDAISALDVALTAAEMARLEERYRPHTLSAQAP